MHSAYLCVPWADRHGYTDPRTETTQCKYYLAFHSRRSRRATPITSKKVHWWKIVRVGNKNYLGNLFYNFFSSLFILKFHFQKFRFQLAWVWSRFVYGKSLAWCAIIETMSPHSVFILIIFSHSLSPFKR